LGDEPDLARRHLANHHFDKVFSLAEANELIPALEVLIRELQLRTNELRGHMAKISKLEPELEMMQLPQMVERHPELREPTTRIGELLNKIESFGCFLKDIDLGLLDFPWEIEPGNVVFLCWQPGEPRLIAWHPVEGGFAQRRSLPGAPKPYLN
jgi:hypothetical protein